MASRTRPIRSASNHGVADCESAARAWPIPTRTTKHIATQRIGALGRRIVLLAILSHPRSGHIGFETTGEASRLRPPKPALTFEMVDPGVRVQPHDNVLRAVCLCLKFGNEDR